MRGWMEGGTWRGWEGKWGRWVFFLVGEGG